VLHRLLYRQIPPRFVAEVYAHRMEQLREMIERLDFMSLPDREIRMRLANPAESASIPAPHVRVPRFFADDARPIEFIVSLGAPSQAGHDVAVPDFTCEATTWTLTIHEGMGHGVQFATVLGKEITLARRVVGFCSTLVEGWAQYVEAELRPELSPSAQMMALQQRQLRAGRAILDPGLHLGQVSQAEVLRVLRDEVGVSGALAQQELERYAFRQPGQAAAYFAGYLGMVELRTSVERRLGADFQGRRFHDEVLGAGFLGFGRLEARQRATGLLVAPGCFL
jgi:uncharacterized protein (DUF885 family)